MVQTHRDMLDRMGRGLQLLESMYPQPLGQPSHDHTLIRRVAGRFLFGSARQRTALEPAIEAFAALSDGVDRLCAEFCRARSPRCRECPLSSLCAFARSDRRRAIRPENYVLDLFSGAGGLSLGLKRAGLSVAAAVEYDRNAAQTYRLNHPEVSLLETDIADVAPEDLVTELDRSPFAIVAGPPCQGYSAAGMRDPNNPKNNLYTEVVRLAAALKPRFVVIENVPGLQRVNGVGFSSRVCRALVGVGYHISRPHLLRGEDFGVAQKRRRLVFFAQRAEFGAEILPPRPTHQVSGSQSSPLPATPTVEHVLRGLPEVGVGCTWEYGEYKGKMIYNASTMAHSPAVIDKISRIGPGEGPISYRRLERTLARTLVAGHRALPVHPWLNRTISVREAARIQGFPDDFVFAGARSNQPLQVANAVPIPMAQAIGATLLAACEDRSQ